MSLFVAVAAQAASFDPDLTWRTLQTDHFNITFHQGEEALADEFAGTMERVYAEMTAAIRWKPRRRTELVLVDRTDSANGYAQTVPQNTIVIYVTAPQEDSTLSQYEDWPEAIGTHEFTHILHLDTNHGLIRVARGVIGRLASTNNLSPAWMVEGLATYQETEHTSGGRGRSPQVEMILRAAADEDQWPPLGNLDGFQPDPPAGNLRYLFGEDFIRFVAERSGPEAWVDFVHRYGSSIPFILPSKKAFGKLLVPMYFAWKKDWQAEIEALREDLSVEGILEGEVVSDGEASCFSPRFSPDGDRLVWSCSDRATGSAIYMGDGDGKAAKVVVKDRSAKNFTWRRDGKALVYAAQHIVNRFNTWSDLYLLDLDSKAVSTLTSGKRARDPDFSPDGQVLSFVTDKVQNNQLAALTVDQQLVEWTQNKDHVQYSTPRWHPSGRFLAVSSWRDGRRDLEIVDRQGQVVRRLTADAAVDRDPEWSRDGEWLFFSSERSGIPNVYALEVRTERLWQVTNVVSGATKPTVNPGLSRLAYQHYSNDGWDVRVMALDPARYLDRGLLPALLDGGQPLRALLGDWVADGSAPAVKFPDWSGGAPAVDGPSGAPGGGAPAGPQKEGRPERPGAGPRLSRGGFGVPSDPFARHPLRWGALDLLPEVERPQEGGVYDNFDQTKVKDAFGAETDYPFRVKPRRYSPFPTLAPRYWVPFVQTTPFTNRAPFTFLPFGVQVTAATGGADVLKQFGWSASASYRTDANWFGWSGSFTINKFLPVYSFGAASVAVPSGYLLEVDPEEPEVDGEPTFKADPERYWEKRYEAYAQVSYPFTYRSTIFARYSLMLRQERDPLPASVYLPRIPVRGTLGRFSAGYRYAWSQQTPYAVSLEDGRIFSVVGSLLCPCLGTFVLDDEGVAKGLTQVQLTSELREYITNPWVPNHVLAFRVGGGVTLGNRDFLGNYQLGGSIGDGAFYVTPDEFRMLRGYPFASDIGDMYWLGNMEYRFPIWRIQRGLGTLPAFLGTLSGAAFVDSGNAFSQTDDLATAFGEGMVGVGAELRFSTVVLYGTSFTGRVGWATGLTPSGYTPLDPRTLYFQFGGSF